MTEKVDDIVLIDDEPKTAAEHPCLVSLAKKWERPFHKPIMYDRKTGKMSADTWVIGMYNQTPSGGISKRKTASLLFGFCPICGDKLMADDRGNEQ